MVAEEIIRTSYEEVSIKRKQRIRERKRNNKKYNTII